MPNELDPIVEQWYLRRDKGELFRVVAVDAATGCIEIQSFGGDVGELEVDAWREMDIEAAEAPEDWTGPFDDIETDDLGVTETAMSPRDWRTSLEPMQAEGEQAWQDVADAIEAEEEDRPLEPYAEEEDKPTKDRAR